MREEHASTKLIFTYEHVTYEPEKSGLLEEHGYGKTYISNGVKEASLAADWYGSRNYHPLLDLIAAIARLSLYKESRCEWSDLPDRYTWLFRREGDLLHITILGLLSYSQERGYEKQDFSVTCDLWKFAAKLQRECHQVMVNAEAKKRHGGDWLRSSREYQDLCQFIEAHKHLADSSEIKP